MDELLIKQLTNKLMIELKATGITDTQVSRIKSILSLFASSLIEVGKGDYCSKVLTNLEKNADIKEKLFIISPIKIAKKDGERIKSAFIKKYNNKRGVSLDIDFENIVNTNLCHSGLLLKYKDLEIDLRTENKIKLFMNLLNN